jgi:PAS domain S-box-containing protein
MPSRDADDDATLPGLGDPATQYELLFRGSPYGLVYLDDEARIVDCNAAARRIFGLGEAELLGKSSFDLDWGAVREDGSPFSAEDFPAARALRSGEPELGAVMGLWNPSEGRRRWIHLDAIPSRGPGVAAGGRPDHVLVWLADVTDRVLAREAEARSRNRFHSLFDNMSEGVALHEVIRDEAGRAVDYRIIEVNARYEAQVGISREAAEGQPGSVAYATVPAPYLAEFCGVAESGRPCHFETYFAPLDKHFIISITPFGRDGFATIFFDISYIKRAQAERERLVGELERKNKELESIVYVASHDLRAPLLNIQGFGQRLGRDCAELASRAEAAAAGDAAAATAAAGIARERIPRSLEFIRASGIKMDKLIAGLLRLSRTGRAELVRELLDMDRLLGEVAASLAFQAERAGATIRILPLPPCYGDEEQLGQVFSNLIDNAIKYRAPGRHLLVTVSGERLGSESRYAVEDTGVGIAPEHLEKVWELFYRLDPSHESPGEGLGLSLVRRIVERHGGRALVESEPGAGSKFIVVLPSGEPGGPRNGGDHE